MLFESEWSSDAIAAPLEHEMFTDIGDRMRSPTDRCNSAKSSHRLGWIVLLTSVVSEMRSRIQRRQEIRHMSAAWAMVDDRTLNDIGISRLEIEYAMGARIGADGIV